jgi:puromycin-sensitive aminopeptidase
MFDVLTYEKGASVLRMLEQYLGADPFRDGIRLYLRRHAYGNSETTDLWNALEDSTRQPARALMDTWIFQPGYPVIKVERDGHGLVLSQQIFQYLQDGETPERNWHVPIFFRAGTKRGLVHQTALLTDRQMRVELSDDADWVVVNAGGHGFYRVRYGAELMNALKQRLQTDVLPVERFNLLSDAWATTLNGLTSLTDYLSLVELLREENDVNVWTAALISSHHMHRIFDGQQDRKFQERLRTILVPPVERLGWSPREGETDLERQLRGELIGALGTLAGDQACQERARNLYSEYERNPDSVERNVVPALVSILAHIGAGAEYEKFYARFKHAQTPQEETRYLFALGAFRQPDLIDRTLKMTVSGDVRTQNAPYLMRTILLNKDAREKAWSFMKAHWEEMLRQYPDNAIPRMCEGVVGLVTPQLEADVKSFFACHPVKQGAKQMEQHLERLRIAVACGERWKDLLQA